MRGGAAGPRLSGQRAVVLERLQQAGTPTTIAALAAGALGGVAAANAIDERTLQIAFGGLTLVIAAQLGRRSLRQRRARLAAATE